MTGSVADTILKLCPEIRLEREVSMAEHTTFRIGGPAEAMVFPKNAQELAAVSLAARKAEIPFLVVGNGSNLLVPDAGLRGLVIRTYPDTGAIRLTEDHCIIAESGASLAKTAVAALDAGLTGLEFAHGIPGTVGGAVLMNAGAYGGEIKHVTETVAAQGTEYAEYGLAECDFGYRHSRFEESKETVLWAKFRLQPGDKAAVSVRMEELKARRRASQPLEMPSAGSFFKRPMVGYAGAYIEQAGLKGFAVGGAQVSEKHAGFVVNRGGATCSDVLRLMEQVQEKILREFGVELMPEVRIIKLEE